MHVPLGGHGVGTNERETRRQLPGHGIGHRRCTTTAAGAPGAE